MICLYVIRNAIIGGITENNAKLKCNIKIARSPGVITLYSNIRFKCI